MKKFLIAVLLIIPIVVVFSLMLTGAIISNTINVNAEKMIIHDINDNVFDTTRTYTLPLEGGALNIIIIILPSISFDAEIAYEYTEDSIGKIELVKQEGLKYVILPKEPGEVGLVIYPRSNYNLKQVINLYISSNFVTDFDIAIDENPIVGPLYIKDSVKLYASFYPAEAIGSNIIQWQSSNPEIVSVDRNGVTKVKGKGNATITATVTDLADVKRTAQIEVSTEQALTKQNKVYLNSQLNNMEWVKENLVLHNGQDIEISEMISSLESTKYKVVKGEQEGEVEVYNIPSEEWDIIGRENFSTIYIDNGGYFLEAGYLDFSINKTLNPTYISNNENVLKVLPSGMLVPVEQGIAKVRATLSNGEYKEIEIKVSHRANTFALNLTETDNRAGIKLERVWGYNFIDNSLDNYIHNHQLFYHSQSATFRGVVIDDFKLHWDADNPEYASVDQNGLVTFTKDACGKDVRIRATELVHGVKTKLTKYYTFRVLADTEAVNIFEKDLSLNAGGQRNIINYLSAYRKRPIALHTDVFVELEGLAGSAYYARISNCVYGNGYTVSSENWHNTTRNSKVFEVIVSAMQSNLQEFVIENTSFKGAAISGDKAIELMDFKSRGMGIEVNINKAFKDTPIKLRYNHLRYFTDCIHIYCASDNSYTETYSYNISVEGSIVGDCAGMSFYLEQRMHYPDSKLLFKNMVFKPSVGPSVMYLPMTISGNVSHQNIPEKIKANVAFEGFIDNYNWKRINDLSSIFMGIIDPSFMDDYPGLEEALPKFLGNDLEKLLKKEKYNNLRYSDSDGQEWVSLMGFVSGMWNNIDLSTITIKDPNYTALELAMPTIGDGGMVGPLLFILRSAFSIPVAPGSSVKEALPMDKSCYIVSYRFKNNQPAILPGQACPSDENLLKRLQGE